MGYENIEQAGLQLEENFKKTVTELLVLQLLTERECFIGELTELIFRRSGGRLSVVFPYAAVYRMLERCYLEEAPKRIAPDGRRRQYYRITENGRAYLNVLTTVYERMTKSVYEVMNTKERERESHE